MIIRIGFRTAGPYKSVEETLDAYERVELPTSQFYKHQPKTTIEIIQGVRIEITEHFGPVLWLSPPKDIPDFNPDVSVIVFINEEQLSFPKNNADCYGVSEKDTIEIIGAEKNETISIKIILSRLKEAN